MDLRQDEDVYRLRHLLTSADVVIEGSRPRALAQLGLGAEQLAAAGPRVWASITGHGRAQGLRVGFGDDAAAAGGFVATVDGAPRFVADAVADPLTGLIAAATVVQLLEMGGRWLADLGLSRIARSMSGHWLRRPDHVPLERPAPRRDPGRPMPLGRDNRRWLG